MSSKNLPLSLSSLSSPTELSIPKETPVDELHDGNFGK